MVLSRYGRTGIVITIIAVLLASSASGLRAPTSVSGAPAPRPRPTRSPTPAPGPTPTPGPASTVTSKATGEWTATSTWSCTCVPTVASIVTIVAGHTVTVSTTAAVAKSVTVKGTLKASRTVSSTLTVSGNLVVQSGGVLDYGTPTSAIPSTITAKIRFTLAEAAFVGGDTMVPLATDVGLWVVGTGKVQTKGTARGGWTTLAATAGVGATQITVDPTFVSKWNVGDQLLIGQTNTPVVGTFFKNENELRTIVADLGGGKYTLSGPLTYAHTFQSIAWTDAWGDSWTETLAPPVANLTRNVVFEAAVPTENPHIQLMDQAKAEIADLAIVGFGPTPKLMGAFPNGAKKPFGRYALHFHMQKDWSRGSYLKEVVIRDGDGDGLHIHDSYGVIVEDLVVYNQAKVFVPTAANGTHAVDLESAKDSGGNNVADSGANDAWLDRPLVVSWGHTDDQRTAAFYLGGGLGAYIVGAHAVGGLGGFASGYHWCEGCGNPTTVNANNPDRTPRVLRATTSSSTKGFFWWQNGAGPQADVDLLAWNNGTGIEMGAYNTTYSLYGVRAIGNSGLQISHHATHFVLTGFLVDGQNKGGAGINIHKHVLGSPGDELYEDGLVQGVGTAVTYATCLQNGTCDSEAAKVQFNDVNFPGDPLISYVWNGDSASYMRFRNQTGLLRSTNFTLYRKDQAAAGRVFDAEYVAMRQDGDTAGTFAAAPRVKMAFGTSYPTCAADNAVATGMITLCAVTDAPTVEFRQGKTLIATVSASGGIASTTFNMGTYTNRRAYFYAKAIGANGRVNYTRVIRVRKS